MRAHISGGTNLARSSSTGVERSTLQTFVRVLLAANGLSSATQEASNDIAINIKKISNIGLVLFIISTVSLLSMGYSNYPEPNLERVAGFQFQHRCAPGTDSCYVGSPYQDQKSHRVKIENFP